MNTDMEKSHLSSDLQVCNIGKFFDSVSILGQMAVVDRDLHIWDGQNTGLFSMQKYSKYILCTRFSIFSKKLTDVHLQASCC